jgi:hypothetical protein
VVGVGGTPVAALRLDWKSEIFRFFFKPFVTGSINCLYEMPALREENKHR